MSDRCYLCGVSEETRHDEDFSNGYDFDKAQWVVDSNRFRHPVCYRCFEDYAFDCCKIDDAIDVVETTYDCPPTIVSWLEDNSETIQKRFASLLNTGDIISATVEDKAVALLRYLKDLAKGCPR
jgi:hypothetical protein